MIKPNDSHYKSYSSKRVSFGSKEEFLFCQPDEQLKTIIGSTYDVSQNGNRFDTITNLNAFLRNGVLYKQNRKTKKNEIVWPDSDMLFVLNPISGKEFEYEITILEMGKRDGATLKTPLSKICFHKIELKHWAFVWIVGPKPYIPERGSKGQQYVFVFDSEDDWKDLSMELIKISQNQFNYSYLKGKFDENVFTANENLTW